tara:strand:+ start:2240 stop:2386 length:147 start_codon:yes stop_codon:yes gene_type:complete
MKTPYLDQEIDYLEGLDGIIPLEVEQLTEYKQIKQALNIASVGVSADI